MAVDRIDDREVDVEVMMLPMVTNGRFQLQLTESELMEAIGRTATALFTLLNQTQPKVTPLLGVVVIKDKVAPLETDIDEVEEITQWVITPEIKDEIVETPAPVEVKQESVEVPVVVAPPAPKVDREATERMIDSYRQQIRLLTQAATQERQLLRTQEQIQLFQQLNRGSYGSSLVDDPKVDLLKRIAHFEREIQLAQDKVKELEQTLQVN